MSLVGHIVKESNSRHFTLVLSVDYAESLLAYSCVAICRGTLDCLTTCTEVEAVLRTTVDFIDINNPAIHQ